MKKFIIKFIGVTAFNNPSSKAYVNEPSLYHQNTSNSPRYIKNPNFASPDNTAQKYSNFCGREEFPMKKKQLHQLNQCSPFEITMNNFNCPQQYDRAGQDQKFISNNANISRFLFNHNLYTETRSERVRIKLVSSKFSTSIKF